MQEGLQEARTQSWGSARMVTRTRLERPGLERPALIPSHSSHSSKMASE
jgi:hypothetical protein